MTLNILTIWTTYFGALLYKRGFGKYISTNLFYRWDANQIFNVNGRLSYNFGQIL